MSGERSGHYVVASLGHGWKDFDDRAKFQEVDEANVRLTLAPAVDSVTNSYLLYRAPYTEVITFFLKPEAWAPDMDNAIKNRQKVQLRHSWRLVRATQWRGGRHGARNPTQELG